QLNGYLYFNDWSDIQIARNTDDSLFLFVDNAAEAEVLGGEVELLAQPSPELTLMLNAAITRAEFTSDLVQGGVVVVADGNEIPFVPDFSLGASVNYIRPLANGLDGVFSANYAHRSSTYSNATNSPLEENDSYNQLGLRAGVEGRNWGLYARVTNALDEEDTTFKVNPVLGFPVTYSTYVRPRTYGLEVRWRF
ncbi:MAG: TonB-dependent receptor, partial [Rhodothermales bacterium]|nr:TonB-dependent receptor [Rhodothermales bacterium]